MKILVVEDDQMLADGLTRSLRHSGYAVDHVMDGRAAGLALHGHSYDVMILDLGLPHQSGLEVLKSLRGKGDGLPVLILTAGDTIEQRVIGLDLGADDFMGKPFNLSELEARVRALVRRRAGVTAAIQQMGSLTYDQSSRSATLDDKPLELSAREVGVLEILMQRAGRLVSKDQLVDHLCEWGEEVSHNAIEVYVHRLRKKFEGSDIHIATVRGLGYCLEKPDARSTEG